MTVQTLRARLTRDDVARLADQRDPEARALSARKVCARLASSQLSDEERATGAEIIRFLAEDAAEHVRRALAVTLQRSANLPRDVARKLADDIDSIALPVIAGSPVLDDDDLIALVRGGEVSRQSAIAGRDHVSEIVVNEIVEVGAPQAVAVAAGNDGAQFNSTAYSRTFERFGDRSDILERFVERSELPLEITEKLISRISDTAIARLVSRHALPPQLAVELSEGARERATVDLVDQAGLSREPRRFVQQLQMNGRLTPSIMLRALFRGHITFFEHAMAELAGVDHAKAWLLIHDAGPLGLEAVFKRSGLPERILPAVRAALSAWHSLEVGDGGARDVAKFRRQLTERIFTQFQGAPEGELAYCLERLDADEAALSDVRAAG